MIKLAKVPLAGLTLITKDEIMNLEITDLCKTYSNGVKALDHVSLTIPNGMFGLLGPNGAGKSTLMRTLATLQEADSGSARLGDIDILTQKLRLKQTLGYLPQEFGFYAKDTPLNLLSHFAMLKGIGDKKERKTIVEGILKRVNLWELKKRKLGSFSGGMKQRFGIAQALLGNPKLIIVDEPTAGLDPEERNRFHSLLSEIGDDVVVVLSTHIVEDVSDLCNKMAIINEGKILTSEEPTLAITGLNGKVWQSEISKENLPECKEKYKVLSVKLHAGQTNIRVLSEAKPQEVFSSVPPNLEDVYFSHLYFN